MRTPVIKKNKGDLKLKKRILEILLSALLVANMSACNFDAKDDIDEPLENIETTESNSKVTDEKATEIEDIESEYDHATHMRYTLNDDGNSYSVCPSGLPDVIKELVIPGEYKGLPVTKVYGAMGERSIETIIISEGIHATWTAIKNGYSCHLRRKNPL